MSNTALGVALVSLFIVTLGTALTAQVLARRDVLDSINRFTRTRQGLARASGHWRS